MERPATNAAWASELGDFADRAAAVGTVIGGKYVLERLLGEGGMGSVWLAANTVLGTKVALKLVRADLGEQGAADRLLTEARAGARVEHSAIVRVFDFGVTEAGDPFIVMEVLEGQTLEEVLQEYFRVSPLIAVQLLLPVLEGLVCVHERGIVHRDLKPSNIFLDRKAKRIQPKVLDFGIAKLDDADLLRKLTRQGTVLGSPSYMSPEQARGLSDVDARTDVWTLAVVLYESITGATAFSGDSYNAVLRAVIEEPVAPIATQGIDDVWLSAILEKGLQKSRSMRFDSARAFGVALAEWALARGATEDVTGAQIASNWLASPRKTPRSRVETFDHPTKTRELDAPLVFIDATSAQRLSTTMRAGTRIGQRGRRLIATFAGVVAFAVSYVVARSDFGSEQRGGASRAAPLEVPHAAALAPPLAATHIEPVPTSPTPELTTPLPPLPPIASVAALAPPRAPSRPSPTTDARNVRKPAPPTPKHGVTNRERPVPSALEPPPNAAASRKTDDPSRDLKDPY